MALSVPPPRFPLLGKIVAIVLVLLALVDRAAGGFRHRRRARRPAARGGGERRGGRTRATVTPCSALSAQRDCTETWDTVQGEGKERKVVTSAAAGSLPPRRPSYGDRPGGPRAALPRHLQGQRLRDEGEVAANWPTAPASTPGRASRLAAAPATHRRCCSRSATRAASAARRLGSMARRSRTCPAPDTRPTGAASMSRSTTPGRLGAAARGAGGDRAGYSGELAFAPVGDGPGRGGLGLAASVVRWSHPAARAHGRRDRLRARWKLNALATRAPQQAVAGAVACAGGNAPADRRRGGRAVAASRPSASLLRSGQRLHPERPGDQVRGPVHRAHHPRRGRDRGDESVARPPDPVPAGRSGIAMFFLLLVSLGEHVPFAWAYLAASTACTALLAFYGASCCAAPGRAWRSAPPSRPSTPCCTCCSSWNSGPGCWARSCCSRCSPR